MDKGYYSDGYWIRSESLESYVKEGTFYNKSARVPKWLEDIGSSYRRFMGLTNQSNLIRGLISTDLLKKNDVRVEVVDAFRCSKCGKINFCSRLQNLLIKQE